MIRSFQVTDLGNFMPNEFSNPDAVLETLVDPSYEVQSMVRGDEVMAIIAFYNYWGRNYSGFFLVSQYFGMGEAYELRKALDAGLLARDVRRVETTSRAHPKIREWHEFLGFKHEGTKVKMMFDQDYDCWALLREGV